MGYYNFDSGGKFFFFGKREYEIFSAHIWTAIIYTHTVNPALPPSRGSPWPSTVAVSAYPALDLQDRQYIKFSLLTLYFYVHCIVLKKKQKKITIFQFLN